MFNQGRHKVARILRKIARRITPSANSGVVFGDIGIEKLGNAPRALVIFSIPGPERYVRGIKDDPLWDKHTVYWESVEIIRQLNAHGFVVDYADNRLQFSGDWTKYSLVIDGSDNLKNALKGQKKIHYATYTHWLTWNQAELQRIQWFKDRTGIVIPMNRQFPAIMSDEYADHLTYYGTQVQADSFSSKPIKHQLNISAVRVPEYRLKQVETARKHFLWLGGGGMVHKGLDLAMEAFMRLPYHLHIAGNMRAEPEFWNWAKQVIEKHHNIHEEGWCDVSSPAFDSLASKCIGIVYPSAAEGGPGSVAQAIHWGLIPIVTKSALVRAETLGLMSTGTTDGELIESITNDVQTVANRSSKELSDQSDAVVDFALKNHTRDAYTKSLSAFLDILS